MNTPTLLAHPLPETHYNHLVPAEEQNSIDKTRNVTTVRRKHKGRHSFLKYSKSDVFQNKARHPHHLKKEVA